MLSSVRGAIGRAEGLFPTGGEKTSAGGQGQHVDGGELVRITKQQRETDEDLCNDCDDA